MLNSRKKPQNDSDGSRFAKLALLGDSVFTMQDFVNIWGIKNRNTLKVTLARYAKRGLLNRIWRGLYTIKNKSKLDPRIVGLKVLNTYAYLSCETVLFNEGVINQKPTSIIFVSNINKKFKILGVNFQSRKLPDELLYNNTGIYMKDGVRIADRKRAVKDIKYFNPKKYYDANI